MVFVAFSNNVDEKGQLQSYYSKYSKLLKKKYKKPVSTSKSKTIVYSVYKINKKYETNTGWYYDSKGNGRSFWINYYLK